MKEETGMEGKMKVAVMEGIGKIGLDRKSVV